MKRVIFIRHGQTLSNSEKIAQGFLSPLNLEGFEQASAASAQFTSSGAQVIYTSNMIRARDTARVLATSLDLPIIETGCLRERLRPSQQRNLSHNSAEFIQIESDIRKNYLTQNYRYSDEENFEDLKVRASQAFTMFLEDNRDTIIAVTHKNFMYYIAAYGMFGAQLSREHALVYITKLSLDNTGIVEFVNPTGLKDDWIMQRWNDHSHLEA